MQPSEVNITNRGFLVAIDDFQAAINCLAKAPTKDVYGYAAPAGGQEYAGGCSG